MRYYIIAGEASGDLHGSNLMKGIYAEDPQAEIRFWGGDLMADVWQKAESGGMGMKNRATPLAAGGGAQPEGMGGVVFHPHATGLVRHYKEGAVMGFVEVLAKARKLLSNVSFCKKDIDRKSVV